MTETEMRGALAREDLCRLIAACYYEPEPAFAAEGVFDTLLAAAREVDEALVPQAQALGDAFCAAETQALLLDYTRLFLGPMQILANPYGSVWLEENRTLMGDTTMAVLALYQEGGFEIDDEFREVPDHIAVELEFLYLLIFQENEARSSGDAARLSALPRPASGPLDRAIYRSRQGQCGKCVLPPTRRTDGAVCWQGSAQDSGLTLRKAATDF
jgi:TorA maturation chaperone TorD